ncbi:YifB family Mg chelatase-like AAA ATPase [Cellulomonas sp. NPDC089187]|uniref:YifB family Mg chelatase-like AAA ATPase n=1 Tax=Cellulomonas sp. NPDC089187 TaxID=3154970 RepID=UPI00341FDA0A
MTALGRALSVGLHGMTAQLVEVEAHLASALPSFTLVGLPDASLTESRSRVRAAVSSAGLGWPARRITVNLSPAALPKHGPGFDLAVAVAVLGAAEALDPTRSRDVVHLGELGLDGRLRPVRGVLPAVAEAVSRGRTRIVVPTADVAEASLVRDAEVIGCTSLAEVVRLHGGDIPVPALAPVPAHRGTAAQSPDSADLSDVLGQREARHAVEVAAAGGHHLLLSGPPGAGKTMLASRMPGLLPDLSEADAVEVSAVHSVAGTFDPSAGLLRRPPYEDPHHTATAPSIVGGGSGWPRPGAASRAHRGVLFLDEAPEFDTRVLQTLRQPLETGHMIVHRSGGAVRFPARFQLVLAANPCPCGQATGRGRDCLCTPHERRRYRTRLEGPLLDRVDLQIDVPAVRRTRGEGPGESTATVAARVRSARAAQNARWAPYPWSLNSEASGNELRALLGPRPAALTDLDRALEAGRLTLRGADRVLRVAWTLADLAGATAPTREDVGRALLLRTRGGDR